jgi:molybdenum cofactor synthesis domain-containing protein
MQPMRRESPYPMVPVEEAQRIIAAHTPLLSTEEIVIAGQGAALDASALGRVLATDIFAPDDMPDRPKSAVDGYALHAADGLAERRVLGELTAGGALYDQPLPRGTAVRIMTGAPLPPGADAVIMVEQTEEHDGILRVAEAVSPGNNMQQVGQDMTKGALVLSRGTVLGAPEIGLLATVGRTRVPVYRRPVVAVLATGDEVYEPDTQPSAGGVRDSNRYALLAAAREAGCEVISLGIARDDEAVQRAAILEGVARADVLLTSGGVSMGTRDLIKPLLAELGTVHFGRIMFKPGKPTTFATIERPDRDTPLLAFGLPGNPVSSLVSFEVFARPALRRMQGDARPERPRVKAILRDPIRTSDNRPDFQRAIISWENGQLVARSTGAQGSSRLLSLRGANALLIVVASDQPYEVGSPVEAMLTGPIQVAP